MVNVKISNNEYTGDVVLHFFDSNILIGNAEIELIERGDNFLRMMSDSVSDFDEDNFDSDELDKSFYIQDIYVEKKYRNKGYFKEIMPLILSEIDKIAKKEFSTRDYYIMLRAYAEDDNVPNEKLVELYSRYGFCEIQKTEEDGIIMLKTV